MNWFVLLKILCFFYIRLTSIDRLLHLISVSFYSLIQPSGVLTSQDLTSGRGLGVVVYRRSKATNFQLEDEVFWGAMYSVVTVVNNTVLYT